MKRKEILKLILGFRKFRDRYFDPDGELYQKLSSGQSPKTLIIGCSDSRVDPAIISSAAPGDIFVVRNVANLVPPYEPSGGQHGVSAAIEFAVVNLKVEYIVILGHRQCGGINALVTNQGVEKEGFVARWMRIAEPAKKRVLEKHPDADVETLCRLCEKESIITSIENLNSFPFIQKAKSQGTLSLLGIYFDLESGELLEFDDEAGDFKAVQV